jgi:tripartite-type tricarboxylate transporter receptor subunit TctC
MPNRRGKLCNVDSVAGHCVFEHRTLGHVLNRDPLQIGHIMLTDRLCQFQPCKVKRSPLFPDVPAISEVAPSFVFTSWVGYFAPAGTPAQIIAKLSGAISEICQEKDVADSIANMGMTAVGSTPDYVTTTIQSDVPLAKSAAQAAGLSL